MASSNLETLYIKGKSCQMPPPNNGKNPRPKIQIYSFRIPSTVRTLPLSLRSQIKTSTRSKRGSLPNGNFLHSSNLYSNIKKGVC